MGTLLGGQPIRKTVNDIESHAEAVFHAVKQVSGYSGYTVDQSIKIVELGVKCLELELLQQDRDYKDEQATGFAELLQAFIEGKNNV